MYLGNPKANPNATDNPYKTIFVYKLDPSIDEKALRKAFEVYGEINKVTVIRDLNGQSRHYGFIEFKHEEDFKFVYKKSSTKSIGGKYIMIGCEKGRTDKSWIPRRFGGGLGESREMPKWLKKELEEIRKKYPELSEEKGEINMEEGEISLCGKNEGMKNNKKDLDSNSSSYKNEKEEYTGKKRNRFRSRTKSRNRSRSRNGKSKKYYKEYEMGEIE